MKPYKAATIPPQGLVAGQKEPFVHDAHVSTHALACGARAMMGELVSFETCAPLPNPNHRQRQSPRHPGVDAVKRGEMLA